MSTHHTDKMTVSLIHPDLIRRAFKQQDIPLGGALKVTDNGNFDVDTLGSDWSEVMSKLTGMVLANHVTETMVVPSNTGKVRDVADALERMLGYPRGQWAREDIEEMIDTLRDVCNNLNRKD